MTDIVQDNGPMDLVKGMAGVCDWTQEGWEYRRAGCRDWSFHIYSEKYAPKRNRCHLCSRPIEFKSAAIRAAAGVVTEKT